MTLLWAQLGGWGEFLTPRLERSPGADAPARGGPGAGPVAAPSAACPPQGVVLQQDSYIEDQKLLLAERALTRSSSRPSSLVEQEKQRSLEKQRQDLANLQKQQAQHLEEKRRREREWEARERALQEREARLAQREQDVRRGQQELERERDELQLRKGAYQCDLERLRAAQRQLEREQEQLRRDAERLSQRQAEHDAQQVRRPRGGPAGRAECGARNPGRRGSTQARLCASLGGCSRGKPLGDELRSGASRPRTRGRPA